jgi:CHAD domain-containing protein
MIVQDSISDRLQHFALAQLDLAIHYLTEAKRKPDVAIHETRRCLKRVRALLRLVKDELPATVYDRDNLYLRNIGRQLSALRDAAVIAETLLALKKEYAAQLPRSTWRELKQGLIHRSRSSAVQKTKRMKTVAAKLQTARTRIEKWPLEFDTIKVVQQGVRQSFRRGQRAMEQALREPTPATFHEWRKQVNHLRHQLQILQTLKLGEVKTTLRAFKSLAELLGLKNDLAVLTRELERSKMTATISSAIQALIQARDAVLTQESNHLGQQLYHQKPKSMWRALQRRNLR